jgi:predicted nucleotidyltransferase
MVKKRIIASVQKYLRVLNQQGIPVRFGVVFGSQATGKNHKWSDIDLLVVSPLFDRKRKPRDIDKLWHVAAYTDSRIEPIAIGEKQFKESDSSAILDIARREGQIIPLAE